MSRAPVDTLTVAADQPDGRPGTQPVGDVQISAAGETLSRLERVNGERQRVALGRSVPQVRLTYRVDALFDDSGTAPGRVLARATALTVDYRGETGPVRRTLTAPGRILNVACLRTDAASPLPCGAPTGAGWRVDLQGADRDSGLLVQLQLD